MGRIGRRAIGLTALFLRAAFGVALVGVCYGVYVSSVEAAFAEDFTAELIRGLEISGVALAVSLAVFGLLYLPGLSRHTHTGWYLAAYALLVTSGVALISGFGAVGSVVDWSRTPVAIAATASNCQTLETSDGNNEYTCDLRWTWSGVAYEQNRETGEIYRTGTRIPIYVDPKTGDVDDHDVAKIVSLAVFSILFCFVSAWLWLAAIVHVRGTRPHSPRRWLRRLDVLA